MGEYRLLLFNLPNIENLWHFEIFGPQDHMELEISYSSYRFHPMSAKVYEDIGYQGYYFSWQIGQVLKILWHFEILT